MTEPRPRGRPKSRKPKPEKAPAKMGRPSPWSAPADTRLNARVPQHVAIAWKYAAFKALVDALSLDFARTMSHNKRVKDEPEDMG